MISDSDHLADADAKTAQTILGERCTALIDAIPDPLVVAAPYVLISMRDVTEQQEAERALRQQKEFAESLVETA